MADRARAPGDHHGSRRGRRLRRGSVRRAGNKVKVIGVPVTWDQLITIGIGVPVTGGF